MDKQILSKLLQAENSTQFLATKMNDPRGLREISLVVQNNPQASQSLAREMAGIILARSDSKEFLSANAPTLAPIFNSLGKDHWKNVQDLIKMEEIAERVKVPSYVGEQKAEDIGTTLFGTPIRGIVAAVSPRTFATSVRDRTINLGSRFFLKIREEQLQQFREAALFNPDVTAVLAQIGKSGSTPKLENSLRTHLFSHGIKVIGIGEQNRKKMKKMKEMKK